MRKGRWLKETGAQVNVALPNSNSGHHPLALAAMSIAGTIGLMVLVFNEFILPVRTDHLEKELGQLNTDVIKLRSENIEKDSKIKALSSKLSDVREQLYAIQTESLFEKGNPFPQGLREIRPGSSAKKIEESYKPVRIRREEGYWSVDLDHSVFGEAVFYLDEVKGALTVSHISYKLRADRHFKEDFLQKKLEAALGSPRRWSRKDYYSWETSRRAVYKYSHDNFIVMDKGHNIEKCPSK